MDHILEFQMKKGKHFCIVVVADAVNVAVRRLVFIIGYSFRF